MSRGTAAIRAARLGGATIRGWLAVNTLAVFAVSATGGIGAIVGSLMAMCWVEQRMIGGRRRVRPRQYVPAGSPARTQRLPEAVAVAREADTAPTAFPAHRDRPGLPAAGPPQEVLRRPSAPGPSRGGVGQVVAASVIRVRRQGHMAVASGALAVAALACVASQRYGNPLAGRPPVGTDVRRSR